MFSRKNKLSTALLCCLLTMFLEKNLAQAIKVDYVNSFENTNHPQGAYWFMSENMMDENAWNAKIDSFASFSKYTFIFLTGSQMVCLTKTAPIHSQILNHFRKLNPLYFPSLKMEISTKENIKAVSHAAAPFSSFTKNGNPTLKVNKEADVIVTVQNGKMQTIIADQSKSTQVFQNE